MEKVARVDSGYLPEDILITGILPRLPVKSLLKFRCVSKSWYSFISSNNTAFIKSHLQNAKSLTGGHGILGSFLKADPPINVIIGGRSVQYDSNNITGSHFVQCSFSSWFYQQPTSLSVNDFTFINNDFTETRQHSTTVMVGVCNGLCCIQKDEKQYFLWNPATRKSYKLPNLQVARANYYGTHMRAWFGFVEATNDYKVFAANFYEYPDQHGFYTVNHNRKSQNLYSLRTNSWKTVDHNSFRDNIDFFSGPGKYMNGKLHWATSHRGTDRWGISYFDLESEQHGLVEVPDSIDWKYHISVGELEGCLSCILDCHAFFDVWIMKQYGLRETWQAVVRLSYWGSVLRYQPFCLGQEGEVIFTSGDGFKIYDPRTKERRSLNWDGATYFHAHVYVESLVSPIPGLQ